MPNSPCSKTANKLGALWFKLPPKQNTCEYQLLGTTRDLSTTS